MNSLENSESKFDSLLKQYREACPEPEGSMGFVPGLWHRIETHKTFLRHARGWTSAYVTVAALLCLLLAVLISVQAGRATQKTYIDILDDNQDTSVLVEAGHAPAESK